MLSYSRKIFRALFMFKVFKHNFCMSNFPFSRKIFYCFNVFFEMLIFSKVGKFLLKLFLSGNVKMLYFCKIELNFDLENWKTKF